MTGLRCLNCQLTYAHGIGVTVLGVMVCPSCAVVAERILERAEAELKMLLTLMKEKVRLSLIEGKLQFGPGAEAPPSKEDVLKAIIELHGRQDESQRSQQQRPAQVRDEVRHTGMSGQRGGNVEPPPDGRSSLSRLRQPSLRNLRSMQETQHAGRDPGSTSASTISSPGVLEGTYAQLNVYQSKTMRPLCRLYDVSVGRRISTERGYTFTWVLLQAARMYLERVPMLQVLQGTGLMTLLCQGAIVSSPNVEKGAYYGCPYLLAQTPAQVPLHTPNFSNVAIGLLLEVVRGDSVPPMGPMEVWRTLLLDSGIPLLTPSPTTP